MKTRKITVKLWTTLKDRLDAAMDRACLRRDAYLNRLLENELPFLEREVKSTNSDEACRYISARLGDVRKPRAQVTLLLREDLVSQLDALCAKRRLCRDAIFNRIIFLLTAAPEVIDLNFFQGDSSWRTEVWSECKHDGPFFSEVFHPLDGRVDPFWPIRAGLALWSAENRWEPGAQVEGLYSDTLAMVQRVGKKWEPEVLYGLSCLLPDVAVPRTAAAKESERLLNELIRSQKLASTVRP